jgi:hypothetical protein
MISKRQFSRLTIFAEQLRTLAVVVSCCWLVVEIAAAESVPPDCDVPIWKQEILEDLRSNRPERFIPSAGLNGMTGVVFLNDQQLVVYALEPSGQLSSRKSHQTSSAFRQRVRIVDVQSGKTTLIKDFNARPHGSTLQVTIGGILVNTGEIVKLYSADFATNQNLTVPPVDEGDMSITSVSPTGETIMINHFNPKRNVSHLEVFDARTLTLKQSWSQSPRLYNDYSISDKGIAASGVVATEFGRTTWKSVGRGVGHCGGNVPTLYSDDELVYGCSKFIAVSINGQVLMTDSFPGGVEASEKKAVAQGGRFVAASLQTVEVKKHLLTEPSWRVTAMHVAVYDLKRKTRIMTVTVDRMPTDDYDFALSPDGSKLAILNDRKVSVCFVPQG